MSWSAPPHLRATRCRCRGPRETEERRPRRIPRRAEIHRWVRPRCETVATHLPQGSASEMSRANCVASLAALPHPTRDGRAHETTPRTGIELRRPPATRLPRRGGVGLPVHAEQRRAGSPEPARPLLHLPVVPRRYLPAPPTLLAHPALLPPV